MITWIVAKDSCEAVGAQLLRIQSDEEQHFLKSTIYQTGQEVGTDKSIWIGFSDMEVDGNFRWTDGTPVQAVIDLENKITGDVSKLVDFRYIVGKISKNGRLMYIP